MTQALVYGCGHGYVPGKCPESDCRNSALAKSLYAANSKEPELAPEADVLTIFDRPSPLRSRAIRMANLVSAEYDVAPEALLGSQKFSELIEPRHVLYWLCRHAGEWAYPAIGRALKRPHSTIMKGVASIEQRRLEDARVSERMARLLAAAQEGT